MPERSPDTGSADSEIIWRPTPAHIEGSHLKRFMDRYGIATVDELLRRSTADIAWYWDAVVKDLGIHFYTPYQQVLDTSQGIPWARWYQGGTLNFAYDCLDKHQDTPRRHKVAVIYEREDGAVEKLTYRELYVAVNRFAHGLKSLGLEPGDRVGIFLPMVPEAVVAVLACMKIGVIYTPIFSGYGAPAAATRLEDSTPRLLITADGFQRRGRIIRMKEIADEAVAATGGIERMVVVHRLGLDVPWTEGRDVAWSDLVAGRPSHFEPYRASSEDPFLLLYTSGTTGKPKGIIHTHGGFPIFAAHNVAYGCDLRETDLLFWPTDLGWIVGSFEILAVFSLGSTFLIYDGSPDYPAPDRLWAMAARHGVSILGASPTVIRTLMPHGDEHPRRHDLSGVRILAGTGEPWNTDPYMWFFNNVGGGRCPLINISGGTECGGALIGCFPQTPVKPCSFYGIYPGVDADVFDEEGKPARGKVGELVVKQPWPGMTRGFWKDPQRYIETYWSRWENVWVQGDWTEVDADGFWYIHGRSDDTINTAGKRVGPAEVETVLIGHPAVADAAAISAPHPVKGEVMVCFVVLRSDRSPSEALREELSQEIARYMGKSLKPDKVLFTRDLPRTRNAKIMRRVIRASYLGQNPGDLTALENPEAVEEIGRAQ